MNINRSRNNQKKPENRDAGVARTPVFGESFSFREVLNMHKEVHHDLG